MSPDEAEDATEPVSADDLRAQRDELIDVAGGLDPNDPDLPEMLACAGFLSLAVFMEDWRPDDLDQAAEAFDVAFRAPGDSADWSLWRASYAHVAAFRYEADPRLELLDEALRRYDEVVRRAGLDDAVVLGVRRNQGQLYLRRRLWHGGGAADAEAAVAHYGAVLEAGHPSSDLPEARYGRGAALTESAFASGALVSGTIDRARLEEAAAELDRALSEARQRPGDEPSWAKDATIRSAYVHCAVWSAWPDPQQAAALEERVLRVLDDPETEALLGPAHFDGFGKLLYEQATLRGDTEGRERAIALIRRAIAQWRPERDGGVARTALCLAVFLQARYYDDKDVRRLHEVAEVANLVLAEGRAEEDRVSRTVYAGGRMMAGWARFLLHERGLVPDSGDATSEAIRGVMDAVEEGDLYFDHSGGVEGMPGWSAGATAADEFTPRFDRLFAAWRSTESEEQRADAALEMLRYLPHMPMFFDRAKEKDALIACVLAFRPDDPDWQRQAHAAVGNVRLRDAMAGFGNRFDDIVDHFTRAGARPPAGAPGAPEDEADPATDTERQHQHAADIGYVQALGARSQHAATGDDRDTARAAWARVRLSPQITEHNRRLLDAKFAAVDAEQAVARGDVAAADRYIRVAVEALDGLAADHPARAELGTALEELLCSRDQLARTLGVPAAPPPADRLTADRLRAEARRLPRDRRARVLGDSGAARLARAAAPWDPAAFQEAMELLQEAYDLAEQGSDDHLRYATALGGGHCALAESEHDPAARARPLACGIDLLEAALRGCGGPEHRLYAHTGFTLAGAHRLRGDHASARRTGLDALRGHAWAALLQSGTGHAAQAAARATRSALEVAAWCLRDNAPADAVRALDACRGLVLHAATTSSTVPERLLAAGREDLAEEWRAAATDASPDPSGAPPTVPSSLRRRVLTVLTTADGGPQDRLLTPPTTTEIADALRASRKDALVYLVPASEGADGTAVVVTSSGAVRAVPLPLLTPDAAPLREYDPAATAARDLGPVPGTPPAHRPPPLRAQLDRLCGWAWHAAVKPLFDTFDTSAGCGPRLVLVPMGTLGLVPWHAAWTEGPDGRRRYALAESEISYAASARLLCEVAARPAVPHTGAALVVGDPTGDLRYAGEEADAVQRVFYPRGQFLGRRAGAGGAGPGTPHEVVSWLTRDGGDDGAVLHLACHAAVTPSARRSSHLTLSSGELSAEELTEAVGAGRRGRLGLVLLAACRSHVSGHGHNEAYSLATAFLVAGARSVVGSLWPVPDDATSVLMFMAHHYLRAEGEPPARALRRAQLWMVDPDRVLPSTLPASLAFRARHIDPDDLSAWAGFTHLGQ
ncbi:CHAT domain-containing protein [Streptomyces flavofungini]|uniref:CHAT domain-containing protein n=1 Tax=Streptomyces flavofungini TaxID=68200 RepID=UPI0025B0C5E6|nr:CHAT domain-containing protein [Streptomyces flavofungini]WJV46496.1 CHAT domain-containing protein [Streptomyces flavofungini]